MYHISTILAKMNESLNENFFTIPIIGWKDAEGAKHNALGKNVYKNDGNGHKTFLPDFIASTCSST